MRWCGEKDGRTGNRRARYSRRWKGRICCARVLSRAAVGEVDEDFTFAQERRAAGRHNPRSPKPVGRNVTIVVMLLVLCIVLLVVFVFVLRAQG